MKVLVIGASGALGRAVLSRLVASCSDIVVFASSKKVGKNPIDLRFRDQIVNTIERTKPDLIMNLAATFSNDFEEAYAINVNATRHILEVVDEMAISTRVLLIGSAAEYGLVSAEENPITEDKVLRPVSTYGMTKAWQTEVAYLQASRGVNVVIARIFNLVGLGLSERLFIGRLHKQIEELRHGERSAIELGPLSAIRDYISMDDAITQLLTIANYGEAGEIYHVASGQPISMRELLSRELANHALDDSIVLESSSLTNRSGYDVPSIYADISKTAALLRKWDKYVNY